MRLGLFQQLELKEFAEQSPPLPQPVQSREKLGLVSNAALWMSMRNLATES